MTVAKTARPPTHGIAPRPRLFRALDRKRQYPVTWICAPPGSGKTSLIASYLQHRSVSCLWYQVDRGDADVATFFHYLREAVPRAKKLLPPLTPELLSELTTFTQRFFRELFGALRSPFVAVLDNYEEAQYSPAFQQVTREALLQIPANGRVIIMSRTGPPSALARLVANRAIQQITWPELRLTGTEAELLINRTGTRRLTREAVRALIEAADGWAAGLVLLQEQLRSGGAGASPRDPVPSPIFDYFAGEVFRRTDPLTQRVLLHTAFLPRVTARMAESLTEVPEAGPILEGLHRESYFTSRYGDGDPVYEYHPLFREFLLSQAHQTYTATRRAEIRRAGGRLLLAAAQTEAAAELFREAQDWESLIRVIGEQAPTLVAQGRVRTLEGWLGNLPEALVAGDPWLLYWRATCHLLSRPADCRRDVEQALAGFRARADAAGAYLAWSTAVFSVIHESQEVRSFDRWIAQVDELRREFPTFPSEEIETRVAAGMLAAVAWRQPQHPEGRRWAERARELAQRHPDPILRAQTWMSWHLYHIELGDLGGAAAVADELLELSRAIDVSPYAAQIAHVALSWMWLTDASEVSRRAVRDGLKLAEASSFPIAHQQLLLMGAAAALNEGDLPGARALLRRVARVLGTTGGTGVLWYHECLTWEALLQGKMGPAAAEAQAVLRHCDTGWPLDEAVGRLLALQALHEAGETREAKRELTRVLAIAGEMGSRLVEFMARLAEAQIALDAGREDEALAALRVAMALGREGGYSTMFGWRPAVMARLCARALQAGIEVEYVRTLIRKRGLVFDSPDQHLEEWPWPIKIYALGRFQVLQDEHPLPVAGKVQKRPLALLKALAALGGADAPEGQLSDLLWPEADGDAAERALTTTLHRLRRLLGNPEAIRRQAGRLSLDPRSCWLDVRALESLLAEAERLVAEGSPSDQAWCRSAHCTEQAVRLYRGDFLANDEESPWAIPTAERLRTRLLRQIQRIARYWERQGNLGKAVECYIRATDFQACSEECARSLAEAYLRLGRRDEALAVYQRCARSLALLGIKPSPQSLALLAALTSG